MPVNIDLKKNSRISRDKNGFRAERLAIISGIVGDKDALLYNALNDVAMPQYGDAHPVIADISVQSIAVSPQGGGRYHAVITYFNDPGSELGPANASIRASATTVVEESKFDINGDPLTTQYSWSGGIVNYDPFTAEVERSRVSYDFEYRSATFPGTEINAYKNKINSVIWNGYAIGTVYCSGISVDQEGENYRIRASFTVDEQGWEFQARASFLDLPLTAHPTNPDANLNLTTGVRPFDVYASVDFTPLGLIIP